jgi:hypothetical protein
MGEKPTEAFVLSLIGGIFSIVGGILLATWLGDSTWYGIPCPILGVYWIILGLMIMPASVLMYSNTSSTRTWGIVIVILSIMSGLNLFAFLGGFEAIGWARKRGAPPPPPPPPPP